MKLMKSILGLAAIAATIPYKVETVETEKGKQYTLTSLTWKANYQSATETEDSSLSIDLLGGLQETLDTVKEVFFTKEATKDFCETVEIPCEESCTDCETVEIPCEESCTDCETAENPCEESCTDCETVAPTEGEDEKQTEDLEIPAAAEVPSEQETEAPEIDHEAMVQFAESSAPVRDAKYDEAVAVAMEEGKISTSMLQRKLSIGYGRASKIIAAMEQEGIVGPYDGKNARAVLIEKN